MDDSSREFMSSMEQPVSHAEKHEHGGLPLKYWNMIQMLLIEQVGGEAWTDGVSEEFKNLINEKPELVAGFSEATRPEQDEMVEIIKKELEAREQARVFIQERVEYFKNIFNFSYSRIFIKAHKRKWGSCSHRKNLNFNYRILFLPQELADYIVVHELCHLKEMSHSKKFWILIEKILPDWRERQKQLKKYAFGVD